MNNNIKTSPNSALLFRFDKSTNYFTVLIAVLNRANSPLTLGARIINPITLGKTIANIIASEKSITAPRLIEEPMTTKSKNNIL
jgi:hypothetical protein